jgi:hypothetical protein
MVSSRHPLIDSYAPATQAKFDRFDKPSSIIYIMLSSCRQGLPARDDTSPSLALALLLAGRAESDIIAIMSDILIRDVPEHTVAEIDRRASESGVSRNEYLRHWLDREIRPQVTVTDDDLQRLSALAGDVADPDVMRQAWS